MVGLPTAWMKASDHVRRLLGEASRHTGLPVEKVISPGSLSRTSRFQPALTALTLGIWRELGERGVRAQLAAGHSLGEIAAFAAAGGLGDTDAVALSAFRGRLMEREADRHPGGMVAVRAESLTTVEEALHLASGSGVVALAGNNMRGHWAISGERLALARISAVIDATPLEVAGPWHSPLMAGAVDEYRAALLQYSQPALVLPLISNREGRAVVVASEAVELLAGQLTHPVDWAACMDTLGENEVSDLVICGPSKALARFVAAGLPNRRIHCVEWPEHIEPVVDTLMP